jgi:hypothetical protein
MLFGPTSRRRFLALVGSGTGWQWMARADNEPLVACLSSSRWAEVESAVDRALDSLALSVRPGQSFFGDGSCPQPATTALCVMAFLSRGHLPGEGPYGAMLTKAIEFVLSKQQPNGLLAANVQERGAEYHHAIAGLMLCEAYGLTQGGLTMRIHDAIMQALRVTRIAQVSPKESAAELGGWRYFRDLKDSDMSVTGWHFMFYRSAKNAEFDVPEAWVTAALGFVHGCYDRSGGGFAYQPGQNASFSMTAAGLLCMTMVGKNGHALAQEAANYLLKNDAAKHWHQYGLYYASQAMAQMGGRYWREFYPKLVNQQLSTQSVTGMWTDDEAQREIVTAWAILSLTPPCQVLPIFQR